MPVEENVKVEQNGTTSAFYLGLFQVVTKLKLKESTLFSTVIK